MKSRISSLSFLLVSLILSSALSVRPQNDDASSARLIDQAGRLPNGDLRGRMDLLLQEVMINPGSRAVVYIYGTTAEIATRTRFYQNHIYFRQFPASRIQFISGRNVGDVRTDMWLVPSGAPEPDIKPEAWIFREIGRAYKVAVTKAMSDLDKETQKLGDHQSYIINYGTASEAALREKWIRNAIPFRRYDASRITLVNGGPGSIRTVIWLVPPKAANPKP